MFNKVLFCLPLLFLLSVSMVNADWESDGGSLSVYPTINALRPSIALTNSDTPFVCWYQNNGSGISQVFAKYYNGTDWEYDSNSLNLDANHHAYSPDVCSYADLAYVAWGETNGSYYQLYCKRFNGSSWAQLGGSLNVDANQHAWRPKLAVNSTGTPYITWSENSLNYCKYYNGASWIQIGTGFTGGSSPVLAINDSDTPYIAYSDNSDVYVKHYNGSDWEDDGASLNVDVNQDSHDPGITTLGNTPYVIWKEYNGSNYQIYVKYLNGSSWIQLGGSLSTDTSEYPQITTINSEVYAAWNEGNMGSNIFVKRFNGSAWEQIGTNPNFAFTSTARFADISSYGTTPYVTWQEHDGTAFQVYEKHFVPSPTATITPTQTLTSTMTPTYTSTPSPTASATFTCTPTITQTSTPTVTNTATLTSTSTGTFTATPSETVTPTLTSTATITATETMTFTATATITITSTITSTNTATLTCTTTSTVTPNNTFTTTSTPGNTSTSTPTVTATATNQISANTATATITATQTITPPHTPVADLTDKITAYPNPAKNTVWFAYPSSQAEAVHVDVYNTAGERVALIKDSSPQGNRILWYTGNIASGIYYYKMTLTLDGVEKKQGLKKIVIQR